MSFVELGARYLSGVGIFTFWVTYMYVIGYLGDEKLHLFLLHLIPTIPLKSFVIFLHEARFHEISHLSHSIKMA